MAAWSSEVLIISVLELDKNIRFGVLRVGIFFSVPNH